jgi:hypothetical protein
MPKDATAKLLDAARRPEEPLVKCPSFVICADCSSLGLDTWVGPGVAPPTSGTCDSCGLRWPKNEVSRLSSPLARKQLVDVPEGSPFR